MRTPSAMAPSRPLRRWAVRLAAPLAIVVVLPGTVSAEPGGRVQGSEELRRKAAAVAAELERLDLRTNQLDEDYNASAIQLTELRQRLEGTRAEVAAAERAITGQRDAARDAVVQAFVGESNDDGIDIGAFDDIATDSRRRTYLTSLYGDRRQAIDDLGAAQQDLADRQRRLEQAEAEVEANVRALKASQDQLETTISERRRLQESIDGELRAAVAEEQRRRDAADAARREAEARAAAERQRAAAEARVTLVASGRTGRVAVNGAEPVVAGVEVTLPLSSSGTPGADVAVRVALEQQGDPYRWAASGPNAFDCSGLVMFAYAAAGRQLPHSSRGLRGMAERISVEQLVPGDLVFGGSPVHHVGIYVGNGQMVHAPHSGDVVRVASIYDTSKPVTFGRL